MNASNSTTFVDPLENYDPKSYSNSMERALAEEPVGRIKHQPHVSVASDTTAAAAIGVLARQHVACLLVEDDGRLVGVFTDREVLNAVADGKDLSECTVAELMTPNPVFVYESDPAAAALSVMAISGYRHVPVLNADEQLVGIVSPQRVTAFLRKHFGS